MVGLAARLRATSSRTAGCRRRWSWGRKTAGTFACWSVGTTFAGTVARSRDNYDCCFGSSTGSCSAAAAMGIRPDCCYTYCISGCFGCTKDHCCNYCCPGSLNGFHSSYSPGTPGHCLLFLYSRFRCCSRRARHMVYSAGTRTGGLGSSEWG